MGGGLLEGGAAQGLFASLPPPFDRRLVETGLGQMMRDESRLGRGDRRELFAQDIGHLPVDPSEFAARGELVQCVSPRRIEQSIRWRLAADVGRDSRFRPQIGDGYKNIGPR